MSDEDISQVKSGQDKCLVDLALGKPVAKARIIFQCSIGVKNRGSGIHLYLNPSSNPYEQCDLGWLA